MDFYCQACGKFHPGEPARVLPAGGRRCAPCEERSQKVRVAKHTRKQALRKPGRALRPVYLNYLSGL